MLKSCSVMAALCTLACGCSERSSGARAESELSRTAQGATVPEGSAPLMPTRIDTLRDAQGEFFSPQYTSLALTRAGNTVALDSDDKQLILFDTTGRELHRVGRNGGGPANSVFRAGSSCLRAIRLRCGTSVCGACRCSMRISSSTTLNSSRDGTSQVNPRWSVDWLMVDGSHESSRTVHSRIRILAREYRWTQRD